ncbi:hypothetical protein H70357_29075 [Paenibacillus sp. FSL H7-0357]|uniref:hypothetical protein n=1 Tax=Paenibacillus sp. FSL H7-0357 TaxID=1536774 RepID=UPI0004F86745|nr:hypothetical protein [Paenibacillus sp. FSL H7-0357]AIQ20304.1 hypothetical protein H70357_29075 [Paenibacillus sp. FSL H7-0357]
MSKILKEALIYALIFITIPTVINLIFTPEDVADLFDYGFWVGTGLFLTAFFIVFVLVFLVLLLKRTFRKSPEKRL